MSGNNSFWQVIAKIRALLQSDPSLTSVLQSDPIGFLKAHGLDAAITLDAQRTTSLSDVLAQSSSTEREAILNALFSLSVVRKSPKTPGAPGTTPTGQLAAYGGYGGYGGGGYSGGGGSYGYGGGVYLGLVAANAALVVNVGAVENAIAVANANAAQLVNAVGNANVYANANMNTNGYATTTAALTADGTIQSPLTNSDLNSRAIKLPDDYNGSDLHRELQALGLSLPRQMALLKRAATSGTATGTAQTDIKYTYRGITFRVVAEMDERTVNITHVQLLAKS